MTVQTPGSVGVPNQFEIDYLMQRIQRHIKETLIGHRGSGRVPRQH